MDNKVPENVMQEKNGILLLEDSSDLESSRVLMTRSIVELEEPSSKVLPPLLLTSLFFSFVDFGICRFENVGKKYC